MLCALKCAKLPYTEYIQSGELVPRVPTCRQIVAETRATTEKSRRVGLQKISQPAGTWCGRAGDTMAISRQSTHGLLLFQLQLPPNSMLSLSTPSAAVAAMARLS